MIKIMHTADWHIGQTFFGYDRSLEHEHFLQWLIKQLHEQDVDVLLVAGDVFDVSNPSAASQQMFYRFIRQALVQNPSLQLVIIAGNHDSAARLEAPLPLLEERSVHIIGLISKINGEVDYAPLLVELRNREGEAEVLCMAVPFLRQGDYPVADTEGNPYAEGVRSLYNQLYQKAKEQQKPDQAIIAMGHLQATGSEISETDHSERTLIGGLECISPESFSQEIAYTALGHIHKAQQVSHRENVRYAGSPLSMSFAEKNYRHGVLLLTLEAGELTGLEKIAYEPLVSLITLPAKPQVPELVFKELERLPNQSTDSLQAPFLEVKVLLNEPQPTLRHEIETILSQKDVRLARIVSVYSSANGREDELGIHLEGLQEMTPLQIAEITFQTKYQTNMPGELVQLFNEVLLEVNHSYPDQT